MHISTSGTGPPVLLLHGWAMHSGIFSDFIERLGERHTVHAVDLPGHGHSAEVLFTLESSVTFLLDYLRTFSEPVTLVGWSLGGTIACECAITLAKTNDLEAVRALMCIASTPKFVADEHWSSAMPTAHFARFYADLEADWQATVERFLALEALGASDEAAELRWLRATVFARGRPSPSALRAGLEILEQVDQRAGLSQLHALPTLWLGGKRDRIVPPAALQWAAMAAGGSAQIIDRAAHAPFLSHPDVVLSALETLLERR